MSNKGMRYQIFPAMNRRVCEMRRMGLTFAEIGKREEMTAANARRIWNLYKDYKYGEKR
jgi:hypothetical protein